MRPSGSPMIYTEYPTESDEIAPFLGHPEVKAGKKER
jgi:hypothetical protein